MIYSSEVLVVALPFSREQRMKRMVQIIAPLRLECAASLAFFVQYAGVIQVALCNDVNLAISAPGHALDAFMEFRQKMMSARVKHSVNRIQPQRIDVITTQPENGVLNKKAAHVIAFSAIKIYGLPPWSAVVIREIWPELTKIISLGTQMVIDNVERHSQTVFMRGVHQAVKSLRSAITILNSVNVGAVITPVASAGELSNGHQLNGRDTQSLQPVQVCNHRIERTLWRKRANVQFVKNTFLQVGRSPAVILPAKVREIDKLRRPVDPFGLKSRGRIGQFAPIIQSKQIARAGFQSGNSSRMVSKQIALERHQSGMVGSDVNFYFFCAGRPHHKLPIRGGKPSNSERKILRGAWSHGGNPINRVVHFLCVPRQQFSCRHHEFRLDRTFGAHEIISDVSLLSGQLTRRTRRVRKAPVWP